MVVTWAVLFGLCLGLLILSPLLENSGRSHASQGEYLETIVSDGQFVWGPNVGTFDLNLFLQSQNSSLLEYVEDIQSWAAYTSINPKILLTVLELRNHWLSDGLQDEDKAFILIEIEEVAMDLAVAFYDHMYTWGSRTDSTTSKSFELPTFTLSEEEIVQINPKTSSASFAIASVLAESRDVLSWKSYISSQNASGFSETFLSLFPDTDLLDDTNNLTPSELPADDFFQLPFPLGAEWTFNGTHSWHGGDIGPDRSSMDFSTNWPRGSTLPDHYTVASHEGIGFVYPPSRTNIPCWFEVNYEMNPGEVWTTSYYHLLNLGDPGDRGRIVRNQSVGKIGMEVCNGGFASSAHVHFTLRYNGAFFDLDGIKLSGWNIHSGPDPYYSGYLERDGEILYPYDRLRNDHHEYYGQNLEYALYFTGDNQEGGNQIQIQIDDPDQNTPGPPADVGLHDFVIEWWMNATPGGNTAPSVNCGSNSNWKNGNIIFDRSRSVAGSEWGISLIDGRIAFGMRGDGAEELTLCSNNRVDDGEWHHIVVQRNRWEGTYPDGQMWIFIDGQLEAFDVGPEGDISYPDDATPGETCGLSIGEECINLDPFLIIGNGKTESSHAFHGSIDDIRFSWWLRYFEDFEPILGFQNADSQTVGLLRFNEGAGNLIFDTAGFNGGTSNGWKMTGDGQSGPFWVLSEIFLKNPIYVPLYLIDNSSPQ